jgi:UDP-N-acetylglucosamine 2-epimerase (non-hydrolysing)/GDP/UDP-N,N'-diacetylbacillosamine 2-epimerase (hydrolysing)
MAQIMPSAVSRPTAARPRRIAALSSSRADYAHLRWVLRAMQRHPEIDLRIVATGAHPAPGFGRTVEEFSRDGFELEAAPECLLDSDSDVGMAKTIGVAVLGLADLLDRLRPDLLLLIADRYEMLAPAAVATALRIPIAHIEGGEVSEGALDDAVRNALTKLSQLHFVPTETARRRVIAMGEATERVHVTGAPSLDQLRQAELPDRAALEQRLGMALSQPPIVAACHPVTLAADETADAMAMFDALETVMRPVVLCYPNADAGHARIAARARAFVAGRDDRVFVTNLASTDYWGLLAQAAVLVGNSSSGIMESASLKLPCVNIGDRQRGRERAANILDCEGRIEAIRAALSHSLDPAFRAGLANLENPYGDGRAGERIAALLAACPLGQELLIKRARPLDPDHPAAFAP